jgi:hypothetical protein
MNKLIFALALILPAVAASQQPVVWRFDSIDKIGGVATTVVGSPKVVATDIGKAVHFEGASDAGDALFLDTLPLTGALDYTLEVVFRPSSKGHEEQRFFHLQEAGTQSRRMFEIRIHGDKWCIDTVAVNEVKGEPVRSGIMLNCDAAHLFPLDRWYAVATTYDGKMLRTYVDGLLQGEMAVGLLPLGKGGTSVGTRYTKRDYFTGDIYSARFSARALSVGALLKAPAKP